jgi:hypothetical protein
MEPVPCWPLDLSADFVADWMSTEAVTPRKAPALLTHDIDSPDGLRKLVDHFLALEESVGARSTSYVVPCTWKLDHGLLREVVARGHEIGVHGYDHSNRTPFLRRDERRRRLGEGRAVRTVGVSGAFTGAYRGAARGSRGLFSVRLEHPDVGWTIPRPEQPLRHGATVQNRTDTGDSNHAAARRHSAISRLFARRDQPHVD